MRSIFALLFFLGLGAAACAADQYQLIAMENWVSGSREYRTALVVDGKAGALHTCLALVDRTRPPMKLSAVFCEKGNFKSGNIPPGDGTAAVADLDPNKGGGVGQGQSGYVGVWRIEQSSGRVTFCGAQEAKPTNAKRDWVCQSANLP